MRHKILLVLFAVMTIMGSAIAQTRSVTGQVVDENGEPIIGANIKIVGSPTGTFTIHFNFIKPLYYKIV